MHRRVAPRGTGFVNNDPQNSHELVLAISYHRLALAAASLQERAVRLNGTVLTAEAVDQLSSLPGTPGAAGAISFVPATISFVVIASAHNRACR